MRVLHILNELRPSGAETMLRSAAAYWRARGIEGEILATGDSRGDYAGLLEAAGYRLHHVPFRRSPAFLIDVFHLLRARSFDAVHIHTERANFWYAALAFLAGRRRIARSIHNTFRFHGALRIRRALQRAFLRRGLGVRHLAVSPSVAEVESSAFGNPCKALLNWFDDARFSPPSPSQRDDARHALGIAQEAFVLISVGNCSEVKNHAAVIRAMALLPAFDLLYLHVGHEESSCGERCLASSLNLAGRVLFLGPALDIAPFLHAADVFLMPSLKEGFGIAAVEAMGAGLPAILANVEGLRDLRAVAPCAEWVAPGPGPIADAIRRAHDLGPARRRALGLELSAQVHAQCSIAAGAGRYADLYREMLAA